MARISNYQLDQSIQDNDLLLASDANDSNKSKNITVGSLKSYIIPPGGTAGQVLRSDGAGGVYWG